MPSTRLVRAATAAETDEVIVTLVVISVDDVPVLYLCDNRENINSNGNDYIACSFAVVLPDQSSDGAKTCKLQIDAVDPSVYKIIKSSIHHKITCDVSVVLASTPDVYEEGPLHFILRNISASAGIITGELYDVYIQDKKLTSVSYTPDSFPGLYF